MNIVEALTAARAKIERGWCQNAIARNAQGQMVYATDDEAVEWCAAGALMPLADGDFHTLRYWLAGLADVVRREVVRETGREPEDMVETVVWFNNHPGRSKADVLKWFDAAIARGQ